MEIMGILLTSINSDLSCCQRIDLQNLRTVLCQNDASAHFRQLKTWMPDFLFLRRIQSTGIFLELQCSVLLFEKKFCDFLPYF